MSVDSKIFVTIGKENYVEVVYAVINQLNTWVRGELDSYWGEHTDAINRAHFLHSEDYKAQSELFTNGVSISGYNIDCLGITFGCGDEFHRTLYVLPNCTCDYQDIHEGEKILFSIGAWGKNQTIMNQVATALAPFGDVYYDKNDCDSEDFVLVYDFFKNSHQFRGE